MPLIYEGVLRGETIEWTGKAPPPGSALRVRAEVIEAEGKPPATDGERVAAILQALANLGGVPGIPDPVAWQREIREDRVLFGREEE